VAEVRAVSSPVRIARTAILCGSAVLLSATSVAAQSAKATPPARSNAARSSTVRGTLFIVGGGAQPPELVTQFVALAGGPGRARIAIFPMASEDTTTGPEKKAQLDSMGAQSFVINVTRAQADADSIVKLIGTATGIWFPGGDQVRITRALQGSKALRAIHERYRAGAVIGGTSAGAAIMSDSMLTGNQFFPGMKTAVDSGNSSKRIGRDVIEVIPGLGFLHDAIVDQHFIKRMRENRLISVILERPSFIGVGIDESTALRVYPDGHWQVYGASAAIVFDARNATVTSRRAPRLGATGMRVSVLPAGSTFDPRTGKATLPSGGE
jgi:cyanophycinase